MDAVTQHSIKTTRMTTVDTWKYLCISLQELQYPYARCQLLSVNSYVLFRQNNQYPQLPEETFRKWLDTLFPPLHFTLPSLYCNIQQY